MVEEWQEWQQGSNFHFDLGHMIYDTSDAYNLSWSEALKSIQNCLQITDARVAAPEVLKTSFYRIEGNRHLLTLGMHLEIYDVLKSEPELFDDVIIKRVKEKTGEAPRQTVLRTMAKLGAVKEKKMIVEPRNSGVVHFDFYHPNTEQKGLFKESSFSTTQDDFVRFLITGSINDL